MTRIAIIDRAGIQHYVEAEAGYSIMEIIRNNGFDELLAICGGCCSCATCHIIIEDDGAGKLELVSEDEVELLQTSDHVVANSRLSCQIIWSDALDGLRVRIAEED